MNVITDEPMSIDELIEFTGKGNIWNSANLGKVIILNVSGGKEIDVDNIAIIKGKKFGLRKANSPRFNYVGMLIK